jgi:hypothetical protein
MCVQAGQQLRGLVSCLDTNDLHMCTVQCKPESGQLLNQGFTRMKCLRTVQQYYLGLITFLVCGKVSSCVTTAPPGPQGRSYHCNLRGPMPGNNVTHRRHFKSMRMSRFDTCINSTG